MSRQNPNNNNTNRKDYENLNLIFQYVKLNKTQN